ncbi:MAG TPA: RNA methyltransferase [Acidobacteriota bacterium]
MKYLHGRNKQIWLLEGKKLIDEAARSGVTLEEIFVIRSFWEKELKWLQSLQTSIFLVTATLLKQLSGVQSPQGVVAAARRIIPREIRQITHGFGTLLYSIRDPGNFGAILRTAEAAGCSFVGYTSDCVDPYQPKVVRGSMGTILRMSLSEVREPLGFLNKLKENGVRRYALFPTGGSNLFALKPQYPCLVIIGSESQGLPQDLAVDERLSIPMAGKINSLNAAVAAGVCFYHFTQSLR